MCDDVAFPELLTQTIAFIQNEEQELLGENDEFCFRLTSACSKTRNVVMTNRESQALGDDSIRKATMKVGKRYVPWE